MPGLIEAATGILVSSERRVEASAQNVSNASTPGYKRQVAFTQALERAGIADPRGAAEVQLRFASDSAQGKLRETGRPLDLAIFGPAFFMLREGERYVYSRGGSFSLGAEGTVTDAAGRVLQQVGGGDLLIESASPRILDDGSVVENGLPTAVIGLFEPATLSGMTRLDGGLLTAAPETMHEASASTIRQGQLENANVVMSDEMVAMMAATRQAEGGARLVQFYDQLVGQAITTFSRSGK